jgi:hypothetical protein
MSKFASLTAGLLARKGEAEPAATPFADLLLTRVGAPATDIRALTPMHAHSAASHAYKPSPEVKALEPKPFEARATAPAAKAAGDTVTPIFGSFGRRSAQELERARHDVELRSAPPQLLPVAPDDEEHHADGHADQQAETHTESQAASQCVSCPGPQPEDTAKTYHVNLRLKRQRFIKLKLSAALLRRPVQDVVAEALDQWFEKLPTEVLGDCACMRARD